MTSMPQLRQSHFSKCPLTGCSPARRGRCKSVDLHCPEGASPIMRLCRCPPERLHPHGLLEGSRVCCASQHAHNPLCRCPRSRLSLSIPNSQFPIPNSQFPRLALRRSLQHSSDPRSLHNPRGTAPSHSIAHWRSQPLSVSCPSCLYSLSLHLVAFPLRRSRRELSTRLLFDPSLICAPCLQRYGLNHRPHAGAFALDPFL
ncbi:uncharacterized protein BJ171DRAFT_207697 [Polychytrium aggregatum]|uniref:uncharacterized protein n=1 Tax=Polychytrium aggregatum TaxID=110093 RepID=UPI0022FE4169|nr:uncharacterized protein BJ171DRAFT_207697 [Polychytrium aggregatum]KAI9208452.1 hypothetical protein BJ171DRAFT_207697 [Polychytrium aggregatum]